MRFLEKTRTPINIGSFFRIKNNTNEKQCKTFHFYTSTYEAIKIESPIIHTLDNHGVQP